MESIFHDLASSVIEQYSSFFSDWIPKEATIAIALEDTYVYYSPNMIHIHLQVGEKIHVDSIARDVYKHARKVEKSVISPYDQQAYYGIGYPIYFNHTKGALIVILPPSYAKTAASEPKPLKFVTGRTDEEWQPIPIEEVAFFESLNKKNWCTTSEGQDYQISLTMKELEQRLPENFIRIHRSYIINIRNVSKITRDFSSNLVIIMKDDQQLPVSQSYVANLRKALEF